MSQFALPLDWPADPRDDEFLIGDSNARAVNQLERWSTWPVMAVLLVGPRKSGRSLLARIFTAKSGGQMIDDAERQSETTIFHAWNHAQETRRPLVIVADAPPPEWKIKLPDLRSRLAARPVARLEAPDEALMRALFVRLFLCCGLVARLVLFLWPLLRTIDLLDQAVLERHKRLSIPLARATLAEAGLIAPRSTETDTEAP